MTHALHFPLATLNCYAKIATTRNINGKKIHAIHLRRMVLCFRRGKYPPRGCDFQRTEKEPREIPKKNAEGRTHIEGG